jgi:uncharacterized membrane protein YeaQ/YmgE (transglycosylase-associated protein family)
LVAVYAVATILGVVAIIAWVTLGMVATAVAGKETLDPESRFGVLGRSVVAAVSGFGLAGMSASYAGGSTMLALVGAVVGALVLVAVSRYLGVEEDADGGSA